VKIDVDDDASFSNVVVLLVLDGNFDDFTGTDILINNRQNTDLKVYFN